MLAVNKKSRPLNIYGIYLIVAGLAGYLSNPEKAKTALYSGAFFGILLLTCAFLVAKNKAWAVKVAFGVLALLSFTFLWRSTVGWMAVYSGQSEKLFAAALISSMFLGALLTLKALLKKPAH
jgi:uncharacterized membrane protein (UPF0136 family)